MRLIRPTSTVLAACVFAVLLAASPASAAFPGKDGPIALEELPHGPTNDSKIYSLQRDRVRELTGGCCRDKDPYWSANGRRIAFARDGAIATMSARGRKVELLTKPTNAGGVRTRDSEPAFTPNGGRILFARFYETVNDFNSELFSIRANGRGLRQLTATPDIAESNPAFSDSGRLAYSQLAIRSFGGVPPDGVFLADRNARGATALRGAERGIYPDWSPNGRRVAFSGGTDDDGLQIFTVRNDGAGLQQLTVGPQAHGGVYSPSGRSVALIARTRLHVVSRNGRAAVVPTKLDGRRLRLWGLSWGPKAESPGSG
jgi:Tol biopolymer transport system component